MCAPKMPDPPDPKETAGAQTQTNVSTATANAWLANVDQKTPYGSLTYNQTGEKFIEDANGGQQYYYNPATGEYRKDRPVSGYQTTTTPGGNGAPAGWKLVQTENGQDYVRDDSNTGGSTATQNPVYADGWETRTGYHIPTFEAVTTLSPEQQAILDQQNIAGLNLSKLAATSSGRLNDLFGEKFDLSGAPAAGTAGNYRGLRDFASSPELSAYGAGPKLDPYASAPELAKYSDPQALATGFGDAGQISTTFGGAGDITRSYGANDFSADRQRVEDAYYDRMRPDLDASRRRVEQEAINRGLQPGSVAYDRYVDRVGRQENDARNVAIQAGGAEQSRLVGMDRDRAVFQNAAQGQDFQQQLARGQFSNAAQQQIYDQLLGRSTFNNTATQANNDNRFRTETGNNQVTQANFDNQSKIDQLNRNLLQQMFENDFQVTGANNEVAQANGDNAYRTTAANNMVTQGNNAINTQTFNEQNALRAAFMNEEYAKRAQPVNEITSLLAGTQIQNPNFVNTNSPQLPTVDMAGLINENYNQRVAQAQAKSAGVGSILGGLAGLFKGVTLSDERTKKNVKKIGSLKGHPLYEYGYKGGFDDGKRHIGVMAQEVEKKRPDAVRKGRDGLRRVDYGALFNAEAA